MSIIKVEIDASSKSVEISNAAIVICDKIIDEVREAAQEGHSIKAETLEKVRKIMSAVYNAAEEGKIISIEVNELKA